MSTINGLNFAVAKRAANYAFSKDDILVIKQNGNITFDLYVKDRVDKKEIKKLKTEYPGFRVFLITIKESE